jgi:hypothetical protein
MTGSALAPIVIPIVAFVFLFLWLAMVYHASAHPSVHGHEARAAHGEREDREAAAREDSAQERPASNRRAA